MLWKNAVRRHGFVSLALVAPLGFACSEAEQVAPEADDAAGASEMSTPPSEAQRDRFREPTYRTLLEFEGGFDPERGGFFLDMLEPGTLDLRAEAMAEVWDPEGLRTVTLPQWCAANAAQSGAAGTVRIRTLPETVASSSPGDDLPDACDIPVGDWPEYIGTGMLCATQRVTNHYDTELPDVHATLLSFTGNVTANGPYPAPFGNAVFTPSGRNAPTDAIGLWSYGDLAPNGGTSDVVWHFRNTSEATWFFTGLVAYRAVEICDDPEGADEDCDGRINNGCGSYAFGAPCLDDIDCQTGNCTEANVCGVSTCGNGFLDGAETDLDCGGFCPGCAGGQVCNADTDCASGWCRGTNTCAFGARPVAGRVLISEFMANPGPTLGSGQTGEYIELYNRGSESIDLQGCEIRDDGGDLHVITSPLVVPAGGYSLLAYNLAAPIWALTGIVPDYEYTGVVLSNSGDQIELRCGSTVIDRVEYGSFEAQQGIAWQRSAPTLVMGAPTFCRAQSQLTSSATFGTPWGANDVCPDVNLACRLVHPSAPGTPVGAVQPFEAHVRVFANGFTDVTPRSNESSLPFQIEVGYGPAGSDASATPATWSWAPASPVAGYVARNNPSGEDFNWDAYRGLLTAPASAGTRRVAARVSEDEGVSWIYCDLGAGSSDGFQPAQSGSVDVRTGLAAPAAVGDLYLSEVQGNPVSEVSDEAGEWLEFHNPTAADLDLVGCVLRDFTSTGNPFDWTLDASFVVPAGGYGVIGNNAYPVTNGNVSLGATYRGGSGGIQLGNSGDRIELDCGAVRIVEQDIPTSMIEGAVEGRTMQFMAGTPWAERGNRDYWCNTRPIVENRYSTIGGAEGYGSPGAANFASCDASAGVRAGPTASAPATQSLPVAVPGSTHRVAVEFELPGVTEPAGLNASYNHKVQVGVAPQGTPAGSPLWTWIDAAPSRDLSALRTGVDIWTAVVQASDTQGEVLDIRARWSVTGGQTWSSASPVWLTLETASAPVAPNPCLLFSEYIEGSSNNKALELWNCGSSPINLADYKICVVQQGTSSTKLACDSPFYALSGTLAAGAVWVVANSGSVAGMTSVANSTTNSANVVSFNGNDPRVLVRATFSGTVPAAGDIIDQIGYVGWPHANNTLADRTFRRKNCVPNNSVTSWVADDTMFVLPNNTFGTHPTSGADALGLPPDFSCAVATVGDPGERFAEAGDLIITEVMGNVALETRKWFEVFNAASAPVSIAGTLIRDQTRFEYDWYVVDSDAAPIAAGAFAVLGGSNSAIPGTPLSRWNRTEFRFDLTAVDSIEMYHNGALVVSHAWNASVWPWSFNTSMALSGSDPTALDPTDPDNWCNGAGAYSITITDYNGSPGTPNSVCTSGPPPAGARAPLPGDIVITEFMPDTSESGTDTQWEWFEVYNRSSDPIEMLGTFFDDTTASTNFTVTSSFVIPSGEYAVFASTSLAFGPSTPPATTTVPSLLYIYDAAMTLSNDGEALTIYTDSSKSTVIDSINFTRGSSGTGFFATLGTNPYRGFSVALRSSFLGAAQTDRQTNTGAWCITPAADAAFTYRFDSTTTQNSGRNQGTPGSANTQCD